MQYQLVMVDKTQLQAAGLKITSPRLRVLGVFEARPSQHLSAEAIYKILHEQGDDIGLATIYRVLTQFEQAGLVLRHNFDEGHSVFELDHGEHHDHIVCIVCGKVEEFIDPTIESRQQKVAEELGYQMTDHSLYIYGVCPKCNKKS